MKILAIESSAITASVAIVDEENVIAEYTINHKKTHSQTLLPMIDEICAMTETEVDDIDAIAVSVGPGSFTGLRIGVATAKGIALSKDKPMIAVPTLEGLAYNLVGTSKVIVPIMDAKRKHVYSGIYTFENVLYSLHLKLQIFLLLLEPHNLFYLHYILQSFLYNHLIFLY